MRADILNCPDMYSILDSLEESYFEFALDSAGIRYPVANQDEAISFCIDNLRCIGNNYVFSCFREIPCEKDLSGSSIDIIGLDTQQAQEWLRHLLSQGFHNTINRVSLSK